MKKGLNIFIALLILNQLVFGQSIVTVFPDSIQQNLANNYEYGVFYVPKTTEAHTDFMNNGDHLNTIRLNIIESALNNSSDLSGTLDYLDNFSTVIQSISNKADKVIFIFEKMPAWLSSSNDGSPAQTPGWYVLNTKPPANYTQWNHMIQQVTDRIVNVYGVSNAYFEIWNEPDLGSWTGTTAEYFELFQNSYDAIKSVSSSIPAGGPATNHWANNISYTAPFGYISSTEGEQSLIANLIDSTISWNKSLDFISWHNFNLTTETYQNAIEFISNKYSSQGEQIPELFVSEWNAPSSVRDSDLHYAFAAKNTITIKNISLSSDVIAAWQDFSSSTNEFHSDYGLLTYGSIHKPIYNVVSLASELKGSQIKTESTVPLSFDASIVNDTLILLISNYSPPPIVAALNHTLFDGHFDVTDLDSAGYIDIATNDLTYLNSIYNGQNTISNSSSLNQAVNNSIPVYNYFDSIENSIHNIEIRLNGYTNNYSGKLFMVDKATNNDQFIYDSLINNGYNQASAISQIQGNQQIVGSAIFINNGIYQLAMQPNSVALLKVVIPNLASIHSISNKTGLSVFPNPCTDIIYLRNDNQLIGKLKVVDCIGRSINTYQFESNTAEIDTSSFPNGIYIIQSDNNEIVKVVKE